MTGPAFRHGAIGIIIGLAGFLFTLIPAGELVELRGYDLLHISLQNRSAPDNIILVAIDEPSFAEVGKQWPWPRSMHARLATALKEAGAAVIAFDVLFPEASQPGEDLVFAEALRQSAPTVLAADLNASDDGRFQQSMLVEALPMFRQYAASGLVGIPVDRDYTVRRLPERSAAEALFSEQIARIFAGRLPPAPEQTYISFTAPPESFRSVSYYQALQPAVFLPPDIFKGKIVIVGKTTTASSEPDKGKVDYFATPFLASATHSRLMSGMEVHANLVNGFLNGRFVIRPVSLQQCLLFAGLGLLGGLLQLKWRPLASGLATLLLAVLYLGLALYVFEQYQLWLPTIGVLVPLLLIYGLFGMQAYIAIDRKKRLLRKAFSHYLSPSILDCVLADPDSLKLGGRKVEATILFSDIDDFTTLSEQRQPEEISQLINTYMTAMTRIILAHNGTIDKFIGDAIMAFWGAPYHDPDHALNACRAAVAMQARMESLNEELEGKGLPALKIRIGINSGTVIAGNMGSAELFDYTVLGDAVNLASRLEGANKEFGTQTMISGFVYEQISARITARRLGTICVKGKSEETVVFELTGMS